MNFIRSLICRPPSNSDVLRPETADLLTPFPSALDELKRRRADGRLMGRVEAYLGNDVPDYFRGPPVLYLCRHVASPNIETLRFLRFTVDGARTIIGQDPKDRFVPENQLKKPLGKLPICLDVGGVSERFRKMTIIDFNASNGRALRSLITTWGEPLVDFHNNLFDRLIDAPARIECDSDWVDRYGRGDLLGSYKRLLALFVAHGIMFEDYPVEDSEHEASFVDHVLRPAFAHVEKALGARPLIAPLVPMGIASTAVWEGYPPEVAQIIEAKAGG